jgi:hypothetical protein
MDHVAVAPVKAPGALIAFGRTIVDQADLAHQAEIFVGLVRHDPSVPAPSDHAALLFPSPFKQFYRGDVSPALRAGRRWP